MKKIILLVLVLFAWKHFYYIENAPKVGAGVMAGGYPYQDATSITSFRHGDFTYSPLSSFSAEARVLAASKFYFDQKARLSPMTVVIGWGVMSDESVYDQLDIWLDNRTYKWQGDDLPVAKYEIENNTASLHLIPDNDSIADNIAKIRNGDLIEITGFVVNVKKSSGWKWLTSTSKNKNDEEDGKIIYVKTLKLINPYERIY
ncbi:hypothetical protein THMIRHAM_11670 [Thiomicrorhabdus immobilis]|uniref:Uncharacterized protein n=1 Tax=Thiomicrorhabdus immobilis TaxID=2791037 RepID=A0ABM7MDC3_9GAMM|nr:hypothetical protein [Thiomicrorhabdus immobilis]BCN93382.1 hypothetical protein THMIRHAM_11670 [Thiomicrorhabdus immobilis]